MESLLAVANANITLVDEKIEVSRRAGILIHYFSCLAVGCMLYSLYLSLDCRLLV